VGLIKEFKEFALKGNVIDLAVAVIIAAALGKVINSIVDDILMPPIGVLVGKHDFADYFVSLTGGHYETLAQAKAAGEATMNYGVFITTVVNFLIVALAVFLVVRQINRMSRKPAAVTAPSMRDCPQCLSAIPKEAKRCKFCTQVV